MTLIRGVSSTRNDRPFDLLAGSKGRARSVSRRLAWQPPPDLPTGSRAGASSEATGSGRSNSRWTAYDSSPHPVTGIGPFHCTQPPTLRSSQTGWMTSDSASTATRVSATKWRVQSVAHSISSAFVFADAITRTASFGSRVPEILLTGQAATDVPPSCEPSTSAA